MLLYYFGSKNKVTTRGNIVTEYYLTYFIILFLKNQQYNGIVKQVDFALWIHKFTIPLRLHLRQSSICCESQPHGGVHIIVWG